MSGASTLCRFLASMAILLAFAAPGRAADSWTLVQAVGEVQVSAPGGAPVSVKNKAPVPDGATIRTGETGRAVLLRGRETIVMAPSSVVTLPSGANRDVSQVKQQSGTLLFKIGKKPEAHFEVDTPYLAAVVKGTTFTVKVTSAGASVHVLEGAVEVATTDRKNSFLTRAGQISSVFAKAANDIFTTGATVFNSGGASKELWGTDVSGFEFAGESGGWSTTPDTQIFESRGAKFQPIKPQRKDEELTERAPERLMEAANAVNETLGSSANRLRTQKPKDGKVVTTDDQMAEKDRREKDLANKKDERDSKAKAEAKDKAKPKDDEPNVGAPVHRAANVWTVTQAKGAIKIDGYPFTNFGDGLARSLPPGTKVETGENSRFAVAHGVSEFVIEANSIAILGDATNGAQPKVVTGQAVRYRETSGRYEAVPTLSPEEIAELQASGELDDAPTQEAAAATLRVGASPTSSGSAAVGGDITLPKPVTMSAPTNPKTEEVRTKVIGGLTLGLYGLTAALVLAFGAQWFWRRYRAKAKEPPTETPVQARLRSIKES